MQQSQAFAVLASTPRRQLIRHLRHHVGEPVVVKDLVDQLADGESLTDADGDGETPARRLRMTLQHVHLPMLGAADAIEYEPGSGTVVYRGSEALEGLLDVVDGTSHERQSSRPSQ